MLGEGISRLFGIVLERLKSFKNVKPEKTEEEKERKAEELERMAYFLYYGTFGKSGGPKLAVPTSFRNTPRERSYTDTDANVSRQKKAQRSLTC